MNNLIKIKKFLVVFFFLGFYPLKPSYAVSVMDGLNYFKRGVEFCEEQFVSKITGPRIGKKRVRQLIGRLNRGIEDKEVWLRQQAPILLRYLYRFRTQAERLLTQRVSLSDSLQMQRKLEGLILSWAVWGITEGTATVGRSVFIAIKDPERSFRESFQEWGEDSIGRRLSEKEIQALEEVYNYRERMDVKARNIEWDMMVATRFFLKQKILKEAGFSEKEREQLGWKKIIQAEKTIELKVPERTTEETTLRRQRFNSAYSRRVDEMKEWMAVGKQLREQKANAYTYVPDFGKKLREDMAYMETGIKTPWQKEQFEILKTYIELIIREKAVTYEQLLAVSLRFSDILSNEERPYLANPYAVQALVRVFPEEIAVPTILGELGFISLNKGEGPKISPIALVISDRIIDGKRRNPIATAYHDIDHILNKNGTEEDFHNELMKRKESLPFEQRRNIELAYHILTSKPILYEEGTFIDDQERIADVIENGLDALIEEALKDKRGFRGVISLSGYSDPYKQVIVDDFKRIFNEIQKAINKAPVP